MPRPHHPGHRPRAAGASDLTDISDFEDHINEILDNLKDLRPVWRQFQRADDQPQNFEKPSRVDANYQRHSKMRTYARRKMQLVSKRPFHAKFTHQFNFSVTKAIADHALKRSPRL